MTKFAASPLPLLGVLLLALALRVLGLTWGLPSATHYFSYHPDESVMLETSSVTMNVFAGRLLPHYYDYPSLQFYLVCFANTLAALFGGVDIVPKNFSTWYPQWAKMYLVGRTLTVSMGAGTVWAVYAIGARLWGKRAGFVAAFLLAVMPLHVQHSHFLTVDVPATFWGMLSLLWSVRLATDDPKPLKAALLAGIFAGLAAATKYNMTLAVLPLLAACVTRLTLPSSPSRFGGISACAGAGLLASLLAFFAACPGALLENTTFLKGVRFEAAHVQNVNDPTFRDTGSGFVYHITHNLDAGMGLPLLLLALVSVGYALYRRQRGDALLAAFALPYYVLISLAAVRYARYTIPLLPILALWVGRMLADGLRLSRPLLRRVAVGVAAAGVLATLILAFTLILPMARTDPRDLALQTVRTAAFPRYTIGFAVRPWFGSVPFSPYFTLPKPGAGLEADAQANPARDGLSPYYYGGDWNTAYLAKSKPDIVALSEYDYDDALRLNDPAAKAYLAVLTQNYTRQLILPSKYQNAPEFPSSGLPHDMTYTNPIVSIYRRKQ